MKQPKQPADTDILASAVLELEAAIAKLQGRVADLENRLGVVRKTVIEVESNHGCYVMRVDGAEVNWPEASRMVAYIRAVVAVTPVYVLTFDGEMLDVDALELKVLSNG